ncbi:MAG TPA: tRNA (adenosine(37)-N6)-threonylcarbamoyltransferase complex ATPase subunit type 1 TsaE [Actinomycetota bacterium]|nr:tRNA (adenosine(37)-N6)-threonylcarbamoyltransferase complex ATPase subunit type 1 TsaE [Actinomycetota bacterium]
MHLELRAATAEETRSIGGAISPLLSPGDAIALTGELGSGKTTFAQGLARGLGFEGHVVSPTFTLVREYRPARLPVIHADVYRLERVRDVLELELEQSAEDGVLLVEWGDAVEALLPNGHLVVELATLDPGEERTIVLRTEGRSWLPRWERLERQLEPWRSDPAAGEAS